MGYGRRGPNAEWKGNAFKDGPVAGNLLIDVKVNGLRNAFSLFFI